MRKGEYRENSKDPRQYSSMDPGMWEKHIITAGQANHARFRRSLAHAFSDRAMHEQESLIQGYVNKLMMRMHEHVGEVQDMVKWYNYTTFDIIGDLSFADSFHCLDESKYHEYVSVLFRGFKAGTYMAAARRYPATKALLNLLIPKKLIELRKRHKAFANNKIAGRLDAGTRNRSDFVDYMLKESDSKAPLSKDEIVENGNVLIIAGSETTATAL